MQKGGWERCCEGMRNVRKIAHLQPDYDVLKFSRKANVRISNLQGSPPMLDGSKVRVVTISSVKLQQQWEDGEACTQAGLTSVVQINRVTVVESARWAQLESLWGTEVAGERVGGLREDSRPEGENRILELGLGRSTFAHN